jgi:hypothetical protein
MEIDLDHRIGVMQCDKPAAPFVLDKDAHDALLRGAAATSLWVAAMQRRLTPESMPASGFLEPNFPSRRTHIQFEML